MLIDYYADDHCEDLAGGYHEWYDVLLKELYHGVYDELAECTQER